MFKSVIPILGNYKILINSSAVHLVDGTIPISQK